VEIKLENGERAKKIFISAPCGEENCWHFFLGSLFGRKNVGQILKTPGMILDENSVQLFPPHTPVYTRFNLPPSPLQKEA